MFTLYTAIGSVILALISVISYLFNKNKDSATLTNNNAVQAQVSAIDAKVAANQNQIKQDQQQVTQEEQNETNQTVLDGINSGNTPKS